MLQRENEKEEDLRVERPFPGDISESRKGLKSLILHTTAHDDVEISEKAFGINFRSRSGSL
jgi:hypothetical protein